jgi:hypothetical protein
VSRVVEVVFALMIMSFATLAAHRRRPVPVVA